ncbi:MAG: hydrogenase expression/synthesis, HypA [Actinoallomurus sp.]|jgi:hydrogenase nickel incorporation protein HypA/HybF|nr:hydrogenase expression/synthesis, HypA [Actinoallomurus sp.]
MHEVGLAEAILEAVEKRAAGRPVTRAKVRAGALLHVVEPSMGQAFQLVTEGTVAEGAAIDVVVTPAQITCRACGHQDGTHDPLAVCPACGGDDVDVTGGNELVLESIEIAEARDVPGNSRRDRGDPAGSA